MKLLMELVRKFIQIEFLQKDKMWKKVDLIPKFIFFKLGSGSINSKENIG